MDRPFSFKDDMTLPSLCPTLTQLQELLEAGNAVQKVGPGPQAHALLQKQQALVQAWESLKVCMEQRRAQLEQACLLAHFHQAVRTPSPWAASVCVRVCACV